MTMTENEIAMWDAVKAQERGYGGLAKSSGSAATSVSSIGLGAITGGAVLPTAVAGTSLAVPASPAATSGGYKLAMVIGAVVLAWYFVRKG